MPHPNEARYNSSEWGPDQPPYEGEDWEALAILPSPSHEAYLREREMEQSMALGRKQLREWVAMRDPSNDIPF